MCKPVIIDDAWGKCKVCELDDRFTITIMGRELKIQYCVPSERGGDFYILEAYGPHCHPDIDVRDIVSFTLDKNTEVYARLN